MASNETSSSQSLPTLPFDLIAEILSRLPVKSLLQFRCVCKSWKSLISAPKFAKKHLSLSTTHSIHCVCNPLKPHSHHSLKSYSLDSYICTNVVQTQFPPESFVYFIGSCNGILCLAQLRYDLLLVQLWNPSIRKFKVLPPISEQPQAFRYGIIRSKMCGFGYDPISDNYKVVVSLIFGDHPRFSKTEVKVHTLGTDSWKNISVLFPFAGVFPELSGKYVSGTINWLVYKDIKQSQRFIASLDLRDESYQEVSLPDCGEIDALSVYRDCLCIISGEDVWTMKEYVNKESWIKLFTISNMRDSLTLSYPYISAKYVFVDDQVLIKSTADWSVPHKYPHKYIFYNFRNGTSKFIEFENIPEVCVESLISPCC